MGANRRIGIGRRIRQNLECQGLQRVSGQDCRCVVKRLMNGWPAASEVVIVHGGQVIVDERIAMQQFHRAAGPQGAGLIAANHSGRLHRQKGAKALSTAQGPVAQGLHEARRPCDLAGTHGV